MQALDPPTPKAPEYAGNPVDIDIDVLLNRTNIPLTRARFVVDAWASGRSLGADDEVVDQTFGEPRGETQGFGASFVDDDDARVGGASSVSGLEKLGQQLLGKKRAASTLRINGKMKAGVNVTGGKRQEQSKSAHGRHGKADTEESEADEEESRVSSLKPKLSRINRQEEARREDADENDSAVKNSEKDASSRLSSGGEAAVKQASARRRMDFLDEVLAEKAKKSKKKKKKTSPDDQDGQEIGKSLPTAQDSSVEGGTTIMDKMPVSASVQPTSTAPPDTTPRANTTTSSSSTPGDPSERGKKLRERKKRQKKRAKERKEALASNANAT